jgi:hypothetical protein
MPNPKMDALMKGSTDVQSQDAISSEIEACMTAPIPEGYDVTESGKRKWCAGKAYGMARDKTGKELNFGK